MRLERVAPERSLSALCRDVLIDLAMMQPEPERSEWLQILVSDGHITTGERERLLGRRDAA